MKNQNKPTAFSFQQPSAASRPPCFRWLARATLLGITALPAMAQQYFTPGNLIVSRSVYTGTASTVTAGAPLPGGGVAVANGTYPNIFQNETPDPSFGVTSPIYLDQLTPSGTLVNSLNVTSALGGNVSTSFPSKSELALSVSPDGSALTFMAYAAPVNTLDASNSNTPGHVDPSNPVGLTYQRSIVQVDANGNVQSTAVNAYTGNNGRAAILANGNYYLVGNGGGNNGTVSVAGASFASGSTTITGSTTGLVAGMPVTGSSKIPSGTTIASVVDATHFTITAATTGSSSSAGLTVGTATAATQTTMISQNTGVQMIPAGSSGNTTVVGVASGSSSSTTGYQNGFNITQAGFAADKSGKDDNFRGEAVYNGTLYVTKGSGSNGINTIYQVNPSGGGYVDPATGAGLPTTGNASSTTINILPGFPTNSAKTGKDSAGNAQPLYHPDGIWFANATTLYVADEGTGSAADITNGVNVGAGLQKWSLVNGTWQLDYILTQGLNMGVQYSIANGPNGEVYNTAFNPAAGGLRQITGFVNGDGTVSIYATTSTVSALTDQGADPNQLVSISDLLGATTPSAVSGETFTTLETAGYGEVLRGVSMTVPEPSTNAAILGGLGLLGILASRRRKAASPKP